MPIDRKPYFDAVRDAPFGGVMDQDQVDGQNYLIDFWEDDWENGGNSDLRWLAYVLATAKWETAHTMLPIEEYGKGSGKSYGVPDPETGNVFYGRGYVQLTWKDNYIRATKELGLTEHEDLVWYPEQALNPIIARQIIFEGMDDGWFTGRKLSDYFTTEKNDSKNARQIVNGNDCDTQIAGIHDQFLKALQIAYVPPILPGLVA